MAPETLIDQLYQRGLENLTALFDARDNIVKLLAQQVDLARKEGAEGVLLDQSSASSIAVLNEALCEVVSQIQDEWRQDMQVLTQEAASRR